MSERLDRRDLAVRIADMKPARRHLLVSEIVHHAGHGYRHGGETGAALEGRVADAFKSYGALGPVDQALAAAIARNIESNNGTTRQGLNETIDAWVAVESGRRFAGAMDAMPLSATMGWAELEDVAARAGSTERDLKRIAALVDQAADALSDVKFERARERALEQYTGQPVPFFGSGSSDHRDLLGMNGDEAEAAAVARFVEKEAAEVAELAYLDVEGPTELTPDEWAAQDEARFYMRESEKQKAAEKEAAENPTYTITPKARAAVEAVAALLPDPPTRKPDEDRAESRHAMTGEDPRAAFSALKDRAAQEGQKAAAKAAPIRPRSRGFDMDR